MRYEKSIEVQAPGAALWRAVTSVNDWPTWTPSVSQILLLDADLGLGAHVQIRQPGLRTLVYRVDEWLPGTRFSWSARTSGVHIRAGHEVQEADDGSRLLLTIDMTGPMAPLAARVIGARTRRYVDTEGDGMRRFAEHLATTPDAA